MKQLTKMSKCLGRGDFSFYYQRQETPLHSHLLFCNIRLKVSPGSLLSRGLRYFVFAALCELCELYPILKPLVLKLFINWYVMSINCNFRNVSFFVGCYHEQFSSCFKQGKRKTFGDSLYDTVALNFDSPPNYMAAVTLSLRKRSYFYFLT
jgi:hypothetical protein